VSYKFKIELEIETEHKDCCNGCKFRITHDMASGEYCRVYSIELHGKWESCTGSDYFEVTRPEICKQNEVNNG